MASCCFFRVLFFAFPFFPFPCFVHREIMHGLSPNTSYLVSTNENRTHHLNLISVAYLVVMKPLERMVEHDLERQQKKFDFLI